MVMDNDPLIGQILGGKYRIEYTLGDGGMGAVYRAHQLLAPGVEGGRDDVGRSVAIKVIRFREGLSDSKREQHVARFYREVEATSQLQGPHIIRVIDFGETPEGVLYLVLELLEFETLRDVMHRDGLMGTERVVHISEQLCAGLSEAHEKGIFHRDLKPENLMLCQFGMQVDYVKILDFGIAHLSDATTLTEEGSAIGTLLYMAPEQIEGKAPAAPTDLYAVGCLVYEMLMGDPPYYADEMKKILVAHLNDPVPRIVRPDLDPAVQSAWNALLLRLMDKDPLRRYGSAGEVATELARIRQLAQGHPPGPAPEEDAPPWTPIVEDTDTVEPPVVSAPAETEGDTTEEPNQHFPPEVDSHSNHVAPDKLQDIDTDQSAAPTSRRPKTITEARDWWSEQWPRIAKWLVVTAATGAVILITQQVLKPYIPIIEDDVPSVTDSRAALKGSYDALKLPEPPAGCQEQQDRVVLHALTKIADSLVQREPDKAKGFLKRNTSKAAEVQLFRALTHCRLAGGCESIRHAHRGIGPPNARNQGNITKALTAAESSRCEGFTAAVLVEAMVLEARNRSQHGGADFGGAARQAYRKVLEDKGHMVDQELRASLLLNLARLNLKDKPEQTVKRASQLLDTKDAAARPLMADAHLYRARAHLKLKDGDQCLLDAQAAVDADSTVARYHYQLGRCLETLEKPAAAAYCRAVTLSGDGAARPLDSKSLTFVKKRCKPGTAEGR